MNKKQLWGIWFCMLVLIAGSFSLCGCGSSGGGEVDGEPDGDGTPADDVVEASKTIAISKDDKIPIKIELSEGGILYTDSPLTVTLIATEGYFVPFVLNGQYLDLLKLKGVPDSVLTELKKLENQIYATEKEFLAALVSVIGAGQTEQYKSVILSQALDNNEVGPQKLNLTVENGVGKVYLGGTESGDVTIKASVSDFKGEISISSPIENIQDVIVIPDRNYLLADGQDWMKIKVEIRNQNGELYTETPVIVALKATMGNFFINIEDVNEGEDTSKIDLIIKNGRGTINFRSIKNLGQAEISGSAYNVSSEPVTVDFVFPVIEWASVKTYLSENGDTLITPVTVKIKKNDDVSEYLYTASPVTVILKTTKDTFFKNIEDTTGSQEINLQVNGNDYPNGEATIYLKSKFIGTATITGYAAIDGLLNNDGSLYKHALTRASMEITSPVKTIRLSLPPERDFLIADGADVIDIKVEVRDEDGKLYTETPVIVALNTTMGNLFIDSTTTGDTTKINIKINDENAEVDEDVENNNTGIGKVSLMSTKNLGTAIISGSAYGVHSDEISIDFVFPVKTVTLKANKDQLLADGTDIVKFEAGVQSHLDALFKTYPVAVNFETSLGSLFTDSDPDTQGPNISTNTLNGIATVNLKSSRATGTAKVKATVTDLSTGKQISSQEITITLLSPIQSITLTSDKSVLYADGIDTIKFEAKVRSPLDSLFTAYPVAVKFETSLGSLFTNANPTVEGQTISSNTTAGIALINLKSASLTGTATLTASVIDPATDNEIISQPFTITVVPAPKILSLNSSQTQVKSDNSDSATITAIVLDVNNAPIPNSTVIFKADSGQISSSSVITNENGQAAITFQSGPGRGNSVAKITATVYGLPEKSIWIPITGTTITTTPEADLDVTALEIGGEKEKDLLTIELKDASGKLIYDEPITLSVEPAGALSWNELGTGYTTYKTDIKGTLKVYIKGEMITEKAILTVSSLGTLAKETYSVNSTGEIFRIISPAESVTTMYTKDVNGNLTELPVIVNAPTQAKVIFSTSLGIWKETGSRFYEAPVTNKTATATLMSSGAGVATVQVLDPLDSTKSSIVTVAIAAPSYEAKKLSLQASSLVVAKQTDPEVNNTIELTASVKNENDQVVGGAPVMFSIENTTGGGERVSPTVVFSDPYGIAKSTFFAGTLASGAEGVKVTAMIMNTTINSSIRIIIGGTAGSIIIGHSNTVESVNNDTAYKIAMSVIVSDSNGSPVVNEQVSINLWPVNYATGYWGACGGDLEGCCEYRTGIFSNEDVNRNLTLDKEDVNNNGLLDPGEDKNNNGLLDTEDSSGDGELTPPNSAAGTILIEAGTGSSGLSGVVTTDANGIGEFSILYLKTSAAWIEDELVASTKVSGSETKTTYKFWLRPSQSDADACILPHSPFNTQTLPGFIFMTVGPDTIVADGESTSEISAFVMDLNAGNVPDDTPVSFFPTLGSIKAVTGYACSDADTPADVKNDPKAACAYTKDGIAKVTLTSSKYVGSGFTTVTAKAGEVSRSTSITLIPGPPSNVMLKPDSQELYSDGIPAIKATPSTLTADGTSSSEIFVYLRDKNGNSVASGELIIFSLGQGSEGYISSQTAVTDENGTAKITYTAPSGGKTGIATVIAQTESQSVILSKQITLKGFPIASVEITIDPVSLPADGQSKAYISAKVTLIDGTSPPDGTKVIFSIKEGAGHGVITPAEAETEMGIALTTLTSGLISETVTIRAASGDRVAEIQIEYTPGSISLEAVPNTVLGTGDRTSIITALLKDESGNPVPNKKVTFELDNTSMGTLSPYPVDADPANDYLSDSKGEAKVQFTDEAIGGNVKIKATWTTDDGDEITGTTTITILPPPNSIRISEGYPLPSEINIKGTGGESISHLIFEVVDALGKPVADGYRIDFSILSGPNGGEVISPPFGTTAEQGKVGTFLRSGLKSGPVSIRAVYYYNKNVFTDKSLAIASGPPVGEGMGMFANFLNISGLWKMNLRDQITVSASDFYSNAVPANTAISFKTYETGGMMDPGSALTGSTDDTRGLASSTLVSVSDPRPINGMVSVTAEAINGGRTTHITSIASYLDKTDNHIVFVGTNGGGVYKSTDSGATWQNISRSSDIPGQNWIQPYVNEVAVDLDTDDRNTVFAATGYLGKGNLYRSLDGGLNWNSNHVEEWNGVLNFNSAILSVICDYDDNYANPYDYVWVGTERDGIYYSTDASKPHPMDFQESSFTGGIPISIRQIIRVPFTHSETAILYAATASGVYSSTDGGKNWAKTGTFTGDHVTSIELIPPSDGGDSDTLVAGTKDAGIWISRNSGKNWYPRRNGLGKGLSATIPLASLENKGTGLMTNVTVGPDVKSENWTVKCIAKSPAKFTVTGTVSGVQPEYDLTDGAYTKIPQIMTFSINPGVILFEIDDEFTFKTTRDDGNFIKDILVDVTHNRLYAITYFEGETEPHPVGNVYAYDNLDAFKEDNSKWNEVSQGLPQFDPPDDKTLFGFHSMALEFDYKNDTQGIYMGSEGINFYKASEGLTVGNTPKWQESKSGLTNRIMSRMPILFSGICSMDIESYPVYSANNQIYIYRDGNYINFWTDEIGDENLEYTYIGAYFRIYIQDENGNPPVGGSTFTATQDPEGTEHWNITYADSVISRGTFRDPTDPKTDIPYTVLAIKDDEPDTQDKVVFTFTPTCGDTAPGCSGVIQTITYPF